MSMTIADASHKEGKDLAFEINNRANKAVRDLGRDKVINAALGTLADDDGKIIALKSFYDRLEKLDRGHIASYAPIEGEDEFRKAVLDSLFEDYRPNSYMTAISTPGGTGAIRCGIFSYADVNDPVICHDFYWAPYKKICHEFKRDFRTYKFFTSDYKFNTAAFKECLEESLKNKDRLVSIINSPGNNPTGYSLSDQEWDQVLEICGEFANKGKKITLIVDVAYIEYAGDGEQKKFFKKFENLNENIFVIVAYSMSKAFTAYGLRSGAAIGISKRKDLVDEFERSLSFSARVNWSNGVHAPQKILVEIENNKEEYKKELEKIKNMLKERADIFIKEAREKSLPMIPYFGGFFTFIPTNKVFYLMEKLESENIFTLPQEKGLRVGICQTKKEEIPRLVDRISYYL